MTSNSAIFEKAIAQGGAYLVAITDCRQMAPVMHGLAALGIDQDEIDKALEREGIEKLIKLYTSLLDTFKAIGVADSLHKIIAHY